MKPAAASSVEIVVFSLESDDEQRAALYRLLSDDEKRRAAAFRFDRHRHRFVSGRGRIREILADRSGCSPSAIDFSLNPFGKPSLCAPPRAARLRFNASSSERLGAIAISAGAEIGLDIEKAEPGKIEDCDLIVRQHFTRDERDWYLDLGGERERAFFRLWTCKEAYLKALGVGLSEALDRFSIDLRGGSPAVARTELESGGRSALSLFQFDLGDGYIACLATPQADAGIEIKRWQ